MCVFVDLFDRLFVCFNLLVIVSVIFCFRFVGFCLMCLCVCECLYVCRFCVCV